MSNLKGGKPPKYVLLQTAIPDYRQAVLQLLAERYGDGFLVMAGKEYFGGTTKTRIKLENNFREIRNIFFLKRFSIQLGCWKEVMAADAVIFEGNPRVLSNWIAIPIRRLLGKRCAIWGHAWPRKGRSSGTMLRDAMYRLTGVVVTYTDTEAGFVRERLPGLEVISAPNSLYSNREITPAMSSLPPRHILYVGRLVAENKPRLLLEGFIKAVKGLPADACLKFVGSGPQEPLLRKLAAEHGVEDRVVFMGHIGDQNKLRKEYETALVSVSPGYVGLSLTQTLGFGVPMIIALDEPHAPEIEAALEGENCLFFRSDDPDDLARAMKSIFSQKADWIGRRRSISGFCAENYSAEKMAQGMAEAFGSP